MEGKRRGGGGGRGGGEREGKVALEGEEERGK